MTTKEKWLFGKINKKQIKKPPFARKRKRRLFPPVIPTETNESEWNGAYLKGYTPLASLGRYDNVERYARLPTVARYDRSGMTRGEIHSARFARSV